MKFSARINWKKVRARNRKARMPVIITFKMGKREPLITEKERRCWRSSSAEPGAVASSRAMGGSKCLSCDWAPALGEHNAQVNIDPMNRPERYLTLDHIVPKAAGGRDDDSNLRSLCNTCNEKRGELE